MKTHEDGNHQPGPNGCHRAVRQCGDDGRGNDPAPPAGGCRVDAQRTSIASISSQMVRAQVSIAGSTPAITNTVVSGPALVTTRAGAAPAPERWRR